MKKPLITLILGTARKGRQSEKVAQAILKIIKKREDCQVELADVKDYTHGHTIPDWEENELTKPWRDLVKKTSAFLIVTPEYNHGYPGELKLLLDQELKAYDKIPVVVCATSAGGFGGTRVVENLLPVFRELGMLISHYSIHVSRVGDFVPDEKFEERVNKAVAILLEMSG